MATRCPNCQSENPETAKFCSECATPLQPSKDTETTETMVAPIEDLTVGSTFAGRYQIIEELGKGGMGRVYRALDLEIKEEVAVKLLKLEIAQDAETIERFRNELKVARKVSHRNICRMHDLGKAEEGYFITMEYVEGEDLKSLIRKKGKLSIDEAIDVAHQVCKGLAEAHELGVIHRDMKPQNIMIDDKGKAKIMDFGIARSVEAPGVTATGMIIGTPDYLSPEQAEGEEADQRSDIYSLGVILYEMVTGSTPFTGATAFSVALKHKTKLPQEPKKLNPFVSEDLNRLILICMEKRREKRFQSVNELLSDLTKIEKGIPTTKRKVSVMLPEEREWENSIAVLPFTNMSADPEQEYFCDGIAEELINALTQIKKLRVVARTSAFSFKEKDLDIKEIGKKLNVDKVLEGSVRKAGNKMRITAQLVNVADGYDLWSQRFDCDMEDIFAIQDEISLSIADKLKIKLLGEEKKKVMKRHTENQEAYNLYLKGRYFWNRRYEGGLQKSIEYFTQAVTKDPLYALAYVGIADSFNTFGLYGWLSPKEAYPKAWAAAQKALDIDDTLGQAHSSLAFTSMFYDKDWSFSEKEFQKSLVLNPKYAEGYTWYAACLSFRGRFEEAIATSNRALELEPLSLFINANAGHIFYDARQYDVAIDKCLMTIEMDPNFMMGYIFLGLCYLGKSQWKEAISAFQKLVKLTWNSPFALSLLGHAYGMSGQKDEAEKILAQLNEVSEERYVSSFYKALLFIGLRQKSKALDYIEKAYLEKCTLLAMTKAWTLLDTLRPDPRFKALLKKLSLD